MTVTSTLRTQDAAPEAEPEDEAPAEHLEGGIQPADSPGFRPLTPPTPTRPRDQGPSRSPSVGPDDPSRRKSDAVWHDPLDDDDDDDGGDDEERGAKRQRV